MSKSILETIKEYSSIVIFGHKNPDGDCYGSEIALKESLKGSFPAKKIFAVGSGLPLFFPTFGKLDTVDDEIISDSLAIIVDTNDISNVEDSRVSLAKELIIFDHHVSAHESKDNQLIDESSCSASAVITEFIKDNNLYINDVIASCLYLGIFTDSGRFHFVKNFEKTFQMCSWLCSKGANPKIICEVFASKGNDNLDIKRLIYSRYQKTDDGVIYAVLPYEEIKKTNATTKQIGESVNLLGHVKGYPIWALFYENEDRSAHLEIRSNGPSIHSIVLPYHGGGHDLAAGAPLDSIAEYVIIPIVAALNKQAREYKKEK